ncbi:uncharacterized protein LOC127768686 [Oryza glaberrima]|uniref:Uncharacterized protein n=2 Tax=Oryza TaxID=4527 RepID=A0A0D3EKW9_9ORYZ|nr:uncharacterized protein LOC127768686 [Oryza glaberrima]
MAAALRAALRRRHAASSPVARLLPYSSPGPCAKGGGAASTLHAATRGAPAPSIQAPSVVRRYCSAGGGYAAVRPARGASPLQVPSLVRRYGSTTGATATATPAAGVPALHRASPLPLFVPRRAYVSPRRRRVYSSEEYSSDEYSSDGYSSGQEYKYVEDCQVAKVMDHQLRRIEKVEAGLKQLGWFQIITVSLLGLVTYQCHSEVSRLDKEVAAPKSESP